MRIGLFTDTYIPAINGVSTSILALKNALEKQGHEVMVVTVNTEKMGYEISDDVIRIPGIPTGIYDYRLTGVYPLKVVNRLKEFEFDVIHSHSIVTVGTFARIFAKQYKIPLVHTYHTMVEEYTHYVAKSKMMTKASKKLIKPVTDFYCDKTITELIVPTKKTYDLFKKKYKYTRDIHIIPTGLPLSKYYIENNDQKEVERLRKKYKLNKNDFVILYVGRIAKEKNIEFLIECQKELNAKLLIVGDGPDREKLEAKASELSNKIIFTGKVPYEKISLYYQLGTIFATASDSETQGLTVTEALAASLPVVVLDDPAFQPVVLSDYNGYLFQTKDEYIAIIKKLQKDLKLIKVLAKQARLSSDEHSDEVFAKRAVAVYQQAIKNYQPKETIKEKIKKGVGKLWSK